MANIEKISVSGTSYDVRDANAAHALTDIAAAGNNIEFARDIQDNYSVQGTGVTVSSAGVASGFTTSDYIYKDGVWNSICIADNFEFQTKFKVNSLKDNDYIASIIYANYTGKPRFGLKVDASGRLQVMMGGNDPAVISASGLIGIGVDYWAKVVYQKGSSVSLSISTDGETFTSVGTSSSTYDLSSSTSTYPFILGAWIIYSGTSQAFTGSIDLTETYFKDGNGNTLWAPIGLQSDKIIINATVPTVDQTYDSTSVNAQSGVAIAGAGFLQNADSTSTNLSIKSSDNTVRLSATGGSVIKSEGYSVSIGYNPSGSTNYATKVGTECYTTQFGIAIGYGASAGGYYSVAIGSVSSPSHHVYASGLYSIAMGYEASASQDYGVCIGPYTEASTSASAFGRSAKATASYAIQIGKGTNSTANTFSVGLSNSNNYQLLDSAGKIPAARLTNAVQGALTGSTITLASANWSSNTQTVTVSGMTSSAFVWVSPAPASASDYASAGILCTAQGTNSLTFTCDTTPSSDISVQVVFG